MALVKSQKARTNKGFQENIKTMRKAGYSKKRAVGTAYGEADLAIDRKRDKKTHRPKKDNISDWNWD